jgi:hypothetical protein
MSAVRLNDLIHLSDEFVDGKRTREECLVIIVEGRGDFRVGEIPWKVRR